MNISPALFFRPVTMLRPIRPRQSRLGFTTVELIVVIVILGILSTIAVARFVGKEGFESRGFYDQAVAVIQQAQKTAIAQRRSIFVTITATRVAACYVAACGAAGSVPVPAPFAVPRTTAVAQANCLGNAAWLCAGAPAAEISLASAVTDFTFSSLGRTNLAALLVIAVNTTVPGEANRTLRVETETGYVHP